MTHLVDIRSVQFENGKPDFKFDKIYRCFQNKGNGLLFRLLNEKENKWAFYNDTKDTVMKITANFGPYSTITVLGKARQTAPETKDGEIQVSLDVDPGATELFISGTANGFRIGFQTETVQEGNIVFENGKPAVEYNKIFKCFKNSGNGLLFRLVNSAEKKWYFYNDTTDYIIKATCEFDKKEGITVLGRTAITGTPASSPRGMIVTLEIEPGYTEPFIQGEAGTYRLSFSAEAVGNDKPEASSAINYINGEPNWHLVDRNAKVYRCFKDDGNGLLFRFIDEKKRLWAFYNDTTDFVMKATVSYPAAEEKDVKPADGATSTKHGGKIEVTIQIPPLTTVVMLKGLPSNYEVAYAAESVNRTAPEVAPRYRCGEPDASLFRYDEVFRCFKDHSNGLMFRLVDNRNQRWGFYNDTSDTQVTASVSFGRDSRVKALGKTRTAQDPEKGLIYILTVDPLQTVPFVEGDITSYVFEFTANKKQRGGVAFTA